jgi:hypothetical protein
MRENLITEIIELTSQVRVLLTEQYRFNAADFDRFHSIISQILRLIDFPPEFMDPWERENYPKIITQFGFFALFFDAIAITAMNQVTIQIKVPNLGRIPLIALEQYLITADATARESLLPVYFIGMQKTFSGFDQLFPRILNEVQTRGFPTIYAAVQARSWIDYDRLATAAQQILTAESPLFVQEFAAFLGRTRPEFTKLTYADLFWLVKTPLDNFRVQSQELIDRIQHMASLGGLTYGDSHRLSFDLEVRPNKSPTPFFGFIPSHQCEDPDFIIISGMSAGLTGAEVLLHESGHALHFLNISPTNPKLAQYLGDYTITEVIAILFGSLTMESAFVTSILSDGYAPANIADVVQLLAFRETYKLLFYAIRFLSVRDLFHLEEFSPATIDKIRSKDTARFQQYLGVDRPAFDLTRLSDQIMHDATAFHALLIVRQLRVYLTTNYGNEWWTNPSAIRYLHERWIAPGFTLDMTHEGINLYGEHM